MAFVTLALCASGASVADASFVGFVDIKGKLYIDGAEHTVKCSAGDGNSIDASTLGTRVFHLQTAVGSKCTIYWDTSDTDTLIFSGEESQP